MADLAPGTTHVTPNFDMGPNPGSDHLIRLRDDLQRLSDIDGEDEGDPTAKERERPARKREVVTTVDPESKSSNGSSIKAILGPRESKPASFRAICLTTYSVLALVGATISPCAVIAAL